jgi:hypothetical protein
MLWTLDRITRYGTRYIILVEILHTRGLFSFKYEKMDTRNISSIGWRERNCIAYLVYSAKGSTVITRFGR